LASPKSEGIGEAEAEAKKRFGFAEKQRHRRSRSRSEEAVRLRRKAKASAKPKPKRVKKKQRRRAQQNYRLQTQVKESKVAYAKGDNQRKKKNIPKKWKAKEIEEVKQHIKVTKIFIKRFYKPSKETCKKFANSEACFSIS
jgi:hypothetical protein